ncbi:MAG TPA: MATE family efflux transporter, partial [Flavobacteriales bacterium]|nr:MATE family efflux transporter [Flavobacteriales bacterium]
MAKGWRKGKELVMESFSGEERDYTAMGVRRAIVLLSIPMVLEMGMEALFAIVDTFFVSKLGTGATATVGLTESLLVWVYSVAWGVGIGCTAVVARRTGEKDVAGARRAAGQSVFIAVLVGLAFGIPCFLLAPQLLALQKATSGTVALG